MKTGIKFPGTQIICPALELGESIEQKMARVMQNNEPIEDTAPLEYTERKDGVLAEYDIRTDRFEVARIAMDKVNATKIATRDNMPNYSDKKVQEEAIKRQIEAGGEPWAENKPGQAVGEA